MKRTTTRKTTTDRFLRGGRRPLPGAAVALTLILAACSAATAESSTLPATQPTSAAAASTEPEPGASLLRAALDRYGSGYSFVSEARVGDELAIRVEGRHVDGSSQHLITSGDGTVEYLVVGGDRWARTPDEEWEVVVENAAAPVPLAALADPLAVTVSEAAGTRIELDARYPAERFGLTGDDLVVHIVIRDLLLRSAGYAAGDGDVRATVDTRFEPLADTTPITAPPRP